MKNKKFGLFFALIFILNLGYLNGGPLQDLTLSDQVEHYKKNYDFTLDYFTIRIPEWKEILKHFQGKPNIHYLEIGVSEGRSALWMLENILTHPTAKITCLDIFTRKEIYERFLSNLILSDFLDKAIMIKGKSQITLKTLPLNSYDIVYIDGSHAAPDVIVDTVLSWQLLKKGGIMIFDDYLWNRDWSPEKTPKIAVDAFLNIFKKELQVIHMKFQVIIKKNN